MSESMEPSLDDELRAVEAMLVNLTPKAIPDHMLNQAKGLMAEQAGELNPSNANDLDELEQHLSQISPVTMHEDMLNRMSKAMDRWQDDGNARVDSVVPFTPSKRRKPNFFSRGMLSAAATVALLGAVTALTIPNLAPTQPNSFAESSPVSVAPELVSPVNTVAVSNNVSDVTNVRNVSNTTYAPDALSHKVTSTSDRGVILSKNKSPLRCIRVDYVDRVKGVDANGNALEIKNPGVDYLLIPVETD